MKRLITAMGLTVAMFACTPTPVVPQLTPDQQVALIDTVGQHLDDCGTIAQIVLQGEDPAHRADFGRVFQDVRFYSAVASLDTPNLGLAQDTITRIIKDAHTWLDPQRKDPKVGPAASDLLQRLEALHVEIGG